MEVEADAIKGNHHRKGCTEGLPLLPGANDCLHFPLMTMHVKGLEPVLGMAVDNNGLLNPNPVTRLHRDCPLRLYGAYFVTKGTCDWGTVSGLPLNGGRDPALREFMASEFIVSAAADAFRSVFRNHAPQLMTCLHIGTPVIHATGHMEANPAIQLSNGNIVADVAVVTVPV